MGIHAIGLTKDQVQKMIEKSETIGVSKREFDQEQKIKDLEKRIKSLENRFREIKKII